MCWNLVTRIWICLFSFVYYTFILFLFFCKAKDHFLHIVCDYSLQNSLPIGNHCPLLISELLEWLQKPRMDLKSNLHGRYLIAFGFNLNTLIIDLYEDQ